MGPSARASGRRAGCRARESGVAMRRSAESRSAVNTLPPPPWSAGAPAGSGTIPASVMSRLAGTFQSLPAGMRTQFKSRFTTLRSEERLTPEVLAGWTAWAGEHARAFHRASSAGEGRNGSLAQMQHKHRGLPTRRSQVWTVRHNFDGRASDGTTPAARFFSGCDRAIPHGLCRPAMGMDIECELGVWSA